jgi:hypothetical protein
VVVLCLPTEDNNDNPIITRPHIVFTDERQRQPIIIPPHIVFTDGRQQRQPNHITTTYCLLTEDNDNPIITRPHIVFTDGRQRQPNHNTTTYYVYSCLPSVNTICGRIMIGLSLLSSVSKHNMWLYYDWVVVVVRQ